MAGKVVPRKHFQRMCSVLAPMDHLGQMFYGMGVLFYRIDLGPGNMLRHTGGITGFRSVVAYVPDDDVFVAVFFNDKNVSVEAGLWSIVRTVRAFKRNS